MESLLFDKGYDQLNDFQKDILKECLKKPNGAGLSLPMGTGKTFLSLMISLRQKGTVLVVASKSLIENWKTEIYKFFGDELEYEFVFHNNLSNFKNEKNKKLILTTPEVLSKIYKLMEIESKFIKKEIVHDEYYSFLQHEQITYTIPTVPYLKISSSSYFYSTEFGCLIVDEAQKYTKIDSQRCRSICALCCKNRWLLSGTLFDEPVPDRILGYHMMLNYQDFPRNLPDTKKLLKTTFGGLNKTIVKRDKNVEFKIPKINKVIISHKLCDEEEQLYTNLKNVLNIIKKKCRELSNSGNTEELRMFNAFKLAMLTYLRQCIVSPLIPLCNIILNSYDSENRTQLSILINDEYKKLNIHDWLSKEESAKSSRIKTLMENLNKFPNERVVVFNCFKTSTDLIHYFLKKEMKNRNILVLDSKMTTLQRGDLMKSFQSEYNNDSILLLSYDLGAEGLNLQCAHTVFITDFWWNTSKTKQAVARVLRYGQKSKIVNIYFFTSNTGIEKALFDKQIDKEIMLKELNDGPMNSNIRTLSIDDIIQLIEEKENIKSIKDVYHYN